MSGAKGKATRFYRLGTSEPKAEVSRVDGQYRETRGVVYNRRGDAEKMGGIQPAVDWITGQATFWQEGCYSMGTHTPGDDGCLATDVLLNHGDNISVLKGKFLKAIAINRKIPYRPRDAHRFAQVGTRVFITNGYDQNIKWDGRLATPIGVNAKPAPPGVDSYWRNGTPGESGFYSTLRLHSPDVTELSYKMTWVSQYGQESEPSDASTTFIANATGTDDDEIGVHITDPDAYYNVALTLDTNPGQDELVDRNLWRSVNKGPYTFLKRIPGSSTAQYLDAALPSAVSALEITPAGDNSPPPVALWCFPFRSRVYYLGLDLPSQLRYSRTNAPEAVPPTNLLDVVSTDGDNITGYALSRDYVVIFKGSSIYMLTHDKNENPILTPVSQGIGAVSDRAITSYNGIVYFLGEQGIYSFDGSQVTSLGIEVEEQVRTLPRAYFSDAIMWTDPKNRRIYLSVNASGKNGDIPNQVWVVHMASKTVTVLEDFNVVAALRIDDEPYVIFWSSRGGSNEWDIGLWDTDIYANRDDPYDAKVSTDWIDVGSPDADKTWMRLDVVYMQTGSHTTKVVWAIDWDDRSGYGETSFRSDDPDATEWGDPTLNWGDAGAIWDRSRVRTVRLDLQDTRGKSIRIGFENNTTKTPMRILGFFLTYVDHGMREMGTDLT